MNESEFDKAVVYTLRIELLNGKVLLYSVDAENKQYLIGNLRVNSDGANEDVTPISFLWFETTYDRQVIVNPKSIVRIVFCFDHAANVVDGGSYHDNFDLLDTGTPSETNDTTDKNEEEDMSEEERLPHALIYHKGNAPEDEYQYNPLEYYSLDEGCLAGLSLELEGDDQLRQFINLIDDDGEETFIPMEQIIVMEFNRNLIFPEE